MTEDIPSPSPNSGLPKPLTGLGLWLFEDQYLYYGNRNLSMQVWKIQEHAGLENSGAYHIG